MRLIPLALAGAVVLGLASTAAAAQRYAAPAGSGTICTQAAPCSLSEAITKAGGNDEVIVGSGAYAVPEPLFPPGEAPGVYIHGDLSAPMPKIVGMTAAVPIGTANATRLSYLDISNSGSVSYAAICNPGSLIERVRVTAVGEGATALTIRGSCTTRDSLILAEGTGSIAVFGFGFFPSTSGSARNLTAIATGFQSTGVVTNYTDELKPGSYTLDLKNSIVSGDGSDLMATHTIGGPGDIVVTNSNFDTAKQEAPASITGGPNQTAAPLFVDATGGDFREAAGSPTIDAGISDQLGLGELDLEGNPRIVGTAPDIGAFEFVPPIPPATQLESLSVKPKAFRAAKVGSAIISRKRRPPLGTRVSFTLSAVGTVHFSLERAVRGRRVGRKCRKRTRANRHNGKCTLFRRHRGGFDRGGAAGANSFRFSGRLSGRALRPGRYRLVAAAGDSTRRAGFRIVR